MENYRAFEELHGTLTRINTKRGFRSKGCIITLDYLTMTLAELLSMIVGLSDSGLEVEVTVPMTCLQQRHLSRLILDRNLALSVTITALYPPVTSVTVNGILVK
jgi:hypothetical protein